MTDSEALLSARLLQSANPEVARHLAGLRPRGRLLDAGQTIFEAGDAADCIYLLRPGKDTLHGGADPLVQVRLAQNGAGAELRFARVVRGDILGEAEFAAAGLDPRRSGRFTSARALTPARVVALPWADLARIFDLDPAIRTRFLRIATRRFLDATAFQHSRGHEDPDIVLADWLVEFAADLGVPASNRVSFPKKFTQAEIADELGVSRETISRRLKEWERSGLVTTSATGLEVVDYSRLVRIAGLHSGRGREALARAVADVAAAVDRGDLLKARNIGADMLRYYPGSPELLHLVALAAARGGDREEAVAILEGGGLAAAGDLASLRARVSRALGNPFATAGQRADEAGAAKGLWEDEDEPPEASQLDRLVTDIAALEARLLKDHAFADAGQIGREQAGQSAQAYAAIYRQTGNWYAGVNAASMALAAGNVAGARRLGGEIAQRLARNSGDYWAVASRAEALLVCGDREGGLAALRQAAHAPGGTDSAKASTLLQLGRLAPLLDLDPAMVRSHLALPGIGVVTGHMFRGSEMDAAAQQRAGEAIRRQAEAILTAKGIGHLYGALACGGDLVIAEAALDLGIELHAVLPFPVERFVELSVRIGDPAGSPGKWQKRFADVLARAASLILADEELPLDRDLDGHFFFGFRFMAGLALLRAATLQTECRLIAVSDGSEPGNMAGSNRALADWIETARPAERIEFPFPRRAPAGKPRGGSSFRPCVFLWDVSGARGHLDVIADLGLGESEGVRIVPRTSRVGREGACLIVGSLDEAIDLAARCVGPSGAVRIICDFGPVLGADLEPDPKMAARLKAGSDLPGFPIARPLATLAFAAQAQFEFGTRLEVRSVGRADERRAGEETHARRRSGLPVFSLSLRSG